MTDSQGGHRCEPRGMWQHERLPRAQRSSSGRLWCMQGPSTVVSPAAAVQNRSLIKPRHSVLTQRWSRLVRAPVVRYNILYYMSYANVITADVAAMRACHTILFYARRCFRFLLAGQSAVQTAGIAFADGSIFRFRMHCKYVSALYCSQVITACL